MSDQSTLPGIEFTAPDPTIAPDSTTAPDPVAPGPTAPDPAAADQTASDPATGTVRAAITGRIEPDAVDWCYLPIEIPVGVAELAVSYDYDTPTPPAGLPGNACDIGIFGPAGHELGNQRGFRGWSGGARRSFRLSAADATPGYLPGPIEPGTWQLLLGPYTVAPQGLTYQVEVEITFGAHGEAAAPNPAPRTAPARTRGRAEYRGDCHLHTVYSDGKRSQAELVADARAAGLDFIVSTEHNSSSAALRWGDVAVEDLLIVNGEEVTTRAGHWPALNLPAGHWIDWRYRDADFPRFVEEVHGLGGLVVAAHPFADCFGCTWTFDYQQVDLIEIWNGPWGLDDQAAVIHWDGLLRAGRWIPAVGDSDSHTPRDRVGHPHNVVLAEDLSADALMAGLRAGHNWIAESSTVHVGLSATDGIHRVGIGDTLHAGAGTPIGVEVTVDGAPGTVVSLCTQLGSRYEQPVADSGSARLRWQALPRYTDWVRLELRRPAPTETTVDTMVALTNPIFIRH
ncbi:MAG TPA: CehA/McbA family metallohydrolase [Pseudonocardiaceae bacterium]|nr:CehA/McbA family metallohydrolase [Pseudonocardiaceae bacterium]